MLRPPATWRRGAGAERRANTTPQIRDSEPPTEPGRCHTPRVSSSTTDSDSDAKSGNGNGSGSGSGSGSGNGNGKLDLPGPIAFVMGGGASLGAAQVGMLQALSEYGVKPDMIVGTSVGALNGAFLASDLAGGANRLSHIWPTITREQIFPGSPWKSIRTLRLDKTHLYSNDGLDEFIDAHLPEANLEDLEVPFAAMATDVDTGAAVALESGPAKSALLASAAMPGFLPGIERDGRLLYDGGLVAKLPIGQALKMGAGTLVLLDCTFPGQPAPRPTNLWQVMEWSISLTQNSQASAALPFVPADVPVIYLPGPPRADFSHLELDHTSELISGAYDESRQYLKMAVDDPDLLYRHQLPTEVVGMPEKPADESSDAKSDTADESD